MLPYFARQKYLDLWTVFKEENLTGPALSVCSQLTLGKVRGGTEILVLSKLNLEREIMLGFWEIFADLKCFHVEKTLDFLFMCSKMRSGILGRIFGPAK